MWSYPILKYCQCYQPLPLKTALRYVREEVTEFIQDPSMDELGDVIRVVNRLAGSLCNRAELTIIPNLKSNVAKVNKRMTETGCVRSHRHLINGKCPSSIG